MLDASKIAAGITRRVGEATSKIPSAGDIINRTQAKMKPRLDAVAAKASMMRAKYTAMPRRFGRMTSDGFMRTRAGTKNV